MNSNNNNLFGFDNNNLFGFNDSSYEDQNNNNSLGDSFKKAFKNNFDNKSNLIDENIIDDRIYYYEHDVKDKPLLDDEKKIIKADEKSNIPNQKDNIFGKKDILSPDDEKKIIEDACKEKGWDSKKVIQLWRNYKYINRNKSSKKTLNQWLNDYKPNKQYERITVKEKEAIETKCKEKGWDSQKAIRSLREYKHSNKNKSSKKTLEQYLDAYKPKGQLAQYERITDEAKKKIEAKCKEKGWKFKTAIKSWRNYKYINRNKSSKKELGPWFDNYKPYKTDKKFAGNKRKRDKKDVEDFENKEIYNKKIKYDSKSLEEDKSNKK